MKFLFHLMLLYDSFISISTLFVIKISNRAVFMFCLDFDEILISQMGWKYSIWNLGM